MTIKPAPFFQPRHSETEIAGAFPFRNSKPVENEYSKLDENLYRRIQAYTFSILNRLFNTQACVGNLTRRLQV